MKRYPSDKQIKTIKCYYYTPTRRVKIKRQKILNIGENMEQLELPQASGMTVNW